MTKLNNLSHIVVGLGQVGSAIKEVLAEGYEFVDGYDINQPTIEPFAYLPDYDVLHICLPLLKNFELEVVNYQKKFLKLGGLIIIHSTVPVGTSRVVNAVHSPVRGIHPNLVRGIKTFVKYFGGEKAYEAAKIFADLGIKCKIDPSTRNTEAMKLWDTTIYAWNVILEKKIYKWCQDNKIDFDVIYTEANQSYNEGYEKLGHPEYKKYILKHSEGKKGGHCLISNCELLDSDIAKYVLDQNEML